MAQKDGYDPVAKVFHWLVAAIVLAQFAVAYAMPPIHRGTEPNGLIALHLELGLLILVLTVARLAWRLGHRFPPPESTLPPWQRFAARSIQILFYGLLLAVPVLGWANASSRDWGIALAGLPLPAIMPAHAPLGHVLGDVHTVVAYGMLMLIGIHTLAGLLHHFVRRDRVLRRMLPE